MPSRAFWQHCALFLFFVYRRADAGGFTNPLTTRCLLYVSPVSDFLKEKLPRQAIPGMLSIAIGTLCVVQIWNFNAFNMYTLFGIGGGFFSAAAYVVISCLAEKGFRSNTEIVFIFRFSAFLLGCRFPGMSHGSCRRGETGSLSLGWGFLPYRRRCL